MNPKPSKNQPASGKYPKVAHIPWLPAGWHTVAVRQYIFKSRPTRIQLLVESGGIQYRTTLFRVTELAYAQVMEGRRMCRPTVQLAVEADDHGTHITSAHFS